MNSTGTKLTRMVAGEANPTKATISASVAATLYAGATLDVAMTVESKSVSVFAFSFDGTGFP
jgi:hypothetical protein